MKRSLGTWVSALLLTCACTKPSREAASSTPPEPTPVAEPTTAEEAPADEPAPEVADASAAAAAPEPEQTEEPPLTDLPEGFVWMDPKILTIEFGVDMPNPDVAELQMTKTARFDKVAGYVVVRYCVNESGGVEHVRVVEPFVPTDPKIDQIVAAAIAKWRFQPVVVNGQAIAVCSRKTFRLNFN